MKPLNSTEGKEIRRRFGLVALIFFGAFCTVALWRYKPIPAYAFGFLSILGVCFLVLPSRSKPL